MSYNDSLLKLPGTVVVKVCVTVEDGDTVKLVWWRGRSLKAIKARVKEAYPNCVVQYGRSIEEYSWGAH